MKDPPPSIAAWLEARTGIQSGIRRFLSEEIPASSGWRQVFGSVSLFLFLVQAFTGVLLAINYAPTPGDAYHSLRYILTEVTGGRLIRSLHHWGASILIVVVVLHMIQVFLYGAYKKPREATWIAGVFLLLVTLGFGLTGYLLPWDNRAYWGTVVTTRIAAQMPLAGQYLSRLLGGEGEVGVVTFARFYGMHVLLLPAASMLLISVHIYLVRRHGVTPSVSDAGKPGKPFYPAQVFKDTLAIFVAFAILFTLAVVAHVPLGQIADPSDTNYIPRPEWYFLFLFEVLKLFTGPLEVFGSTVLPNLAVLALLLVPFVDRGRMVKVTKRTVAFAFICLAVTAWTGLTARAILASPSEEAFVPDYSGPLDWLTLSAADLAGIAHYRAERCGSCHGESGQIVPKSHTPKNAAWVLEHVKRNSSARRGGPSAISAPIKDAQIASFATLLTNLTPKSAAALRSVPDFALIGALVYEQNNCASCHAVNGVGGKVGPSLNGVARRRSRSWIQQHFARPTTFSPGTIMPAYKLSTSDAANLTNYLLSLDPE